MPISREELERRRIDLTFPIATMLTDRSDEAFTSLGIMQSVIQSQQRDASLEEVEAALESLISEGRVVVDDIGGNRWYAIVIRRLGFLGE